MKSFAILGLTGQGIETGGEILSNVLKTLGYKHRVWRDFSTIIRGGHTAYEIYISEDDEIELPPRLEKVDLAIVWDDEGVKRYKDRVKNEYSIYGSKQVTNTVEEKNILDIPKIGFNVWAVGVITGALGISFKEVQQQIQQRFKDQKNQDLFYEGFQLTKTRCVGRPLLKRDTEYASISGNDALSLGAIAGGVRHYFGYPITPASEILENLSEWLPPLGGATYQVEDEIAAIHAAIGCSFSGKRTIVATSGPGISLMTEGIGYCSATEIPLVIIDNQRGGPSTGMPTKTEQSDLNHLKYGGHGEFSRVLLTPTSVIDCITVIQEALNLADYYQCPVIIALDLDLALRRVSLPWTEIEEAINGIVIDRGRLITENVEDGKYIRYESLDGLPPNRTIPGVKGGAYVASGDEHDERGYMEPDFKEVRQSLHLRRLHKTDDIIYHRAFSKVGSEKAPITIIGTGAMGELIEHLVNKDPETYQGILLRQLSPVPLQELIDAIKETKKVIVAEYNATGQIRTFIKEAIQHKEVNSILRFDGEHYTEEEFEKELVQRLGVST
ncbi:2-oxoacid:acceptor oxidoreductase family protein [Alkalihalobacterium alkalinitrilicum]|uniref:2-oxoacid:acceptor oxidoreductase family protein n=1 Tax=Alkalihalobacterium alkalinitrilicum TaxID=427920 RepID=UPI001302EA37|nr:2-oxoacid:acceptor oxidoreductase family protein [Alkalihalobacterium alkalinitrilicum]